MKRKKGFSLIEILLSIAIFSILSVFVLQMFSTAKKLNENARELDRSVLVAETIFERIQAKQFTNFEEESDTSVMTFHYDGDWKPIDTTDFESVYRVVVNRQEVPTFDHVVSSYQLKVIKTDPSDQVEESVLYELEMEMYNRQK